MTEQDPTEQTLPGQDNATLAVLQAGLHFTEDRYDLAAPLFKQVPKGHEQYPTAVIGLFNCLWAMDGETSREEAMLLLDTFLAETDRSDPKLKPAVAQLIKIKISLLQSNQWTRPTE